MRSADRESEPRQAQLTVTQVMEDDEAKYLEHSVALSARDLGLQSEAAHTPGRTVGFLLVPNPTASRKRSQAGQTSLTQPQLAGQDSRS